MKQRARQFRTRTIRRFARRRRSGRSASAGSRPTIDEEIAPRLRGDPGRTDEDGRADFGPAAAKSVREHLRMLTHSAPPGIRSAHPHGGLPPRFRTLWADEIWVVIGLRRGERSGFAHGPGGASARRLRGDRRRHMADAWRSFAYAPPRLAEMVHATRLHRTSWEGSRTPARASSFIGGWGYFRTGRSELLPFGSRRDPPTTGRLAGLSSRARGRAVYEAAGTSSGTNRPELGRYTGRRDFGAHRARSGALRDDLGGSDPHSWFSAAQRPTAGRCCRFVAAKYRPEAQFSARSSAAIDAESKDPRPGVVGGHCSEGGRWPLEYWSSRSDTRTPERSRFGNPLRGPCPTLDSVELGPASRGARGNGTRKARTSVSCAHVRRLGGVHRHAFAVVGAPECALPSRSGGDFNNSWGRPSATPHALLGSAGSGALRPGSCGEGHDVQVPPRLHTQGRAPPHQGRPESPSQPSCPPATHPSCTKLAERVGTTTVARPARAWSITLREPIVITRFISVPGARQTADGNRSADLPRVADRARRLTSRISASRTSS